MRSEELSELISRQRPGWSLEQAFYTSEGIYEFERRGWLAAQWFVIAHASEISEAGSYIVRELLGESIIVVRDKQGTLRAFHNVCRHRGSRICDKDGRGTSLVCPYHAWSYHLDGSLRAAPALPDNIERGELGLRPVAVRDIAGIVLASLRADPCSLDVVAREWTAGLTWHGAPTARIAARRQYPTRGNWKLVLENFLECYHCIPAHREYSGVMQHVDALGKASPQSAERWQRTVEEWLATQADPDSPLGRNQLEAKAELIACTTARAPIGAGRQTQSQDGLPVAPLMGRQCRYDGGVSSFLLGPFVYIAAPNDYIRMIQFLPTAAESTDVIITWLVEGSASEAEVDIDRLIWLWDVTTLQDKALIERNAAGVRSLAYTPGPYSTLETWTSGFVNQYLCGMAQALSGGRDANFRSAAGAPSAAALYRDLELRRAP
jgi:phenylpropionate dioxygenase-like ring-hydroxylating dioxygenase large terminal subunit